MTGRSLALLSRPNASVRKKGESAISPLRERNFSVLDEVDFVDLGLALFE
jgi:hypothetical protein